MFDYKYEWFISFKNRIIVLKNLFSYILSYNLKFFFNNNFFYICGKYGSYKIRLPNFFFIKITENFFRFIFFEKYKFVSFFKNFLNTIYKTLNIYFFRIKLRGLGYKAKKFGKKIIRFFFGNIKFVYLFVPDGVIFFKKKRKLIFLSNNKSQLNLLFYHMLKLKERDRYERTNMFLPAGKYIIIRKKR